MKRLNNNKTKQTHNYTALGKCWYQVNNFLLHDFFLLLHKNICCGYSLHVQVPPGGVPNKSPQHMFHGEKRKNINTFLLEKGDLSIFTQYEQRLRSINGWLAKPPVSI